jgi:hypothetical protein
LLQHLIESICDMPVLRAVGVESEMPVAYAGLHQGCWPRRSKRPRGPGKPDLPARR